jgi:hypothetical protein
MLAAALTQAPAGAPTPADPTTEDIRCFIAMAAAAQNADGEMKPAMTAGVIYYLGKLDGRTPSLDLETRTKDLGNRMTVEDFRDETLRCGAAFVARGQALQQMGERLNGKVQPAPSAPTPK